MTDRKTSIEILNLNIVLGYNYKNSHITNHMCQICKSHIMAPTYESKNSCDLNCSIIEGKCKHLFHKQCLDKYIKSGNIVCPIDMTSWNNDHEVDCQESYKKLVQLNTNKIKSPMVTCIANNKK